MIFILISWVFNGLLLSLIYLFGSIFTHQHLGHHLNWLLWGYGTVTLLMLLGASSIGHYLFRMFLGGRQAISRERQKIDYILCEILEQLNQARQTNYKLSELHIAIIDRKDINAQAFGVNTIILTDGLLASITEDELRAVLAHEMGHLYFKDSLILMVFIFGSIATRIFAWLYSVYTMILAGLTKITGGGSTHEGLGLISIFALVPLLLFLPVIVLNWIASQIFNLSLLFMSKKYEYRADKFAKDLGYQQGLISFLEKSQAASEHDNSIIGKIFATHPAPMKRIGKLERN